MKRIIRSNAVETSNQASGSEMNLHYLHPTPDLIANMVSINKDTSASQTTALATTPINSQEDTATTHQAAIINAVQWQIQQLAVEMIQLQTKIAETKTLLNSVKAKLKQRILYTYLNKQNLNKHRGMISGKIVSIFPDEKAEKKLGLVYRLEVALERNYATKNHQTIKLQAGQTATAKIIYHRRIVDMFLKLIK
jgi:hypothetical protein